MTTPAPPFGSSHSTGDGQVHVGGDNSGFILQMSGLAGEKLPRDLRRLLRLSPGPRPTAAAELLDVGRIFVEPPNFRSLSEKLTGEGVLILTGEPGTGRRTTALKLLLTPDADERTCREIATELEEDEEPSLDLAEDVEGDGLLLDLSAHDFGDSKRWIDAVLLKRPLLRERQCTLVVLVSPGIAGQLDVPSSRLVGRLRPPTPRAVLAAHLSAFNIHVGSAALDELVEPVADRGLGAMARLASLIADERDGDPRAGLPVWIDRARAVFDDRPEALTHWLGEHQDAADRALLLSAAMLEGCSTDAVWSASRALLHAVRFTPPQLPLLERQGVGERLTAFGFSVDRDRTVHLTRKDFHHRHVREHFFTDYPDLRSPLTHWVVQLGRHRTLSVAEHTVLTLRFTEQCLGIDHPQLVTEVIPQWARLGKDFTWLAGCVHAMLRSGLLHDEHGAHFRRQTWEWARQPPAEFADDFLRLLATVCEDVIVPAYPGQAAVRLHHLARHPRTAVADHAVDILRRAATRDRRFLRRLVHRLCTTLEDHGAERDVVLFGRLVRPELFDVDGQSGRMLGEPGVRSQLTRSWSVVLSRPSALWTDGVQTWLDAALHPRRSDHILDILVSACGRDLLLSSRLEHVATRRFATSPNGPRTSRLLTALRERLDMAHNLHFLTP